MTAKVDIHDEDSLASFTPLSLMNADHTGHGEEQVLGSPKQVETAVEQLCRETAHRLIVRAPRLDFSFFRTTELLPAVTPLITGDLRNHFHILIDDKRHFLDSCGRVIHLARKFSSYVKVQALPPEYSDSGEIFIVSDSDSYLYVRSADLYPARFAVHSPGRARQLDHQFRQLWDKSIPIAGLHPLGL